MSMNKVEEVEPYAANVTKSILKKWNGLRRTEGRLRLPFPACPHPLRRLQGRLGTLGRHFRGVTGT